MIGRIGFLFYYYTMSVLPLGDAVTLLSTSPILTIFAARLVLKESLTKTHILAAFTSFFGAMLLAKPTFFFPNTTAAMDENHDDGTGVVEGKASSSTPAVGYITAILGACCGSAVHILIRQLNGVHTLHLLFSWSVFGGLYSIMVILFFGWRNRNDPSSVIFAAFDSSLSSRLYIGGLVVFGSLGHFLLNYAGRTAPAGLGSIVRSSGIMWSYFLQITIFHQVPNKFKLIGVTLIVISLLIISSIASTKSTENDDDDDNQTQDSVNVCPKNTDFFLERNNKKDEEATVLLVEKLEAANLKTPTRIMTSLRYGSID